MSHWMTVRVCRTCGAVGMKPGDNLSGKYVLYCRGCRKLKSRSSFRVEKRLVNDSTNHKTEFTKNGTKQLDLSDKGTKT